jgi:putative heme d1 biosynthesis radical SAM protein NirJ1
MLSISKLLGGGENYGDALRYSPASRRSKHGAGTGLGPVVVWNITRLCNLRCRHCYAGASQHPGGEELTGAEAKKLITELAAFKVPVLLLSGGEPLLRQDIFKLASIAVDEGIRVTLSTNGTLITRQIAQKIKEAGVSYVGVSLDGLGEVNDFFRGVPGAFDQALAGIRECLAVGQKVGLRFTLNRYNTNELENIFKLIETENIPRACSYHLVYAGRGAKLVNEDLTHEQSRAALDLIIEKTLDFQRRGLEKEILTVDNHADGIYLYLKLREREPTKAKEAYTLLVQNGGNRSGIAIGAIDWEGFVLADQFTRTFSFGNVRERSFGDIWKDESHPVLAALRNRRAYLKGRCAGCGWLNLCNGNLRARAEAFYGDFWASDPACYLREEEIDKGTVLLTTENKRDRT